ncbi:serine hydrolase domain-containing protein [Rhizobium oryzicola]|uniref:Serine hydrolase domain-containing protein n=1 Tax=Rhizobium oryzicola TaxID=1232668 RepID=A0ABT8T204_9HYPH|nr:serine hydrolase domain-containing protein [Rhizobium oryzicola]MDO1584168.1 serine hydrolase domain-containing protein [Rhizobium oryzicola]
MPAMLNWSAAAEATKSLTDQWKANEPGGAVIGFDAEGIRFAQCGGVENLNTLAPFSCHSVVRYASVTKHAFCAMVLAHPDLISLEDRLGDHLPELQEPLASVTVGRALDMSGGLPDVRECLSLLGLSVYTETQAKDLMSFVARQTRLNYPAGTEISYSNTGYRLVETVLERKGAFFRDFIRELAHSADASFDAPDVWNDAVAGLVPGYWHTGEKWQLSAAGLHISASGSLTGSAESLTNWLRALMRGEGRLAGVLEKLSANRPMADGRMNGYGLGIRQSRLGDRLFPGHGGSHPGYKSYFLLDPETQSGFVVVSNREDTNGYRIALLGMAALLDLPLPTPSTALQDGLYVSESGPDWLEVKGSVVTSLDADETVYEESNGWVSSQSASQPVRLKMDGDNIIGEVGHAPRRYLPVTPQTETMPNSQWVSPEGARFDIEDGHIVMGVGPVRHRMPLKPLGDGRYLFTLYDGPWTKRVCLHQLNENRLQLVLNRARMIEYFSR